MAPRRSSATMRALEEMTVGSLLWVRDETNALEVATANVLSSWSGGFSVFLWAPRLGVLPDHDLRSEQGRGVPHQQQWMHSRWRPPPVEDLADRVSILQSGFEQARRRA